MEDGAEYSGKTVDEAIKQAESQIGVGRDELQIEIITPGRSGVFGIGAESARITARRRSPVTTPDTPAPDVRDDLPSSAETAEARRPHDTGDFDSDDRDGDEDDFPASTATSGSAANGAELLSEASGVLRQLLLSMGFDAEVSVRSPQDPMMLAINGENLGVLIGRRGDNLAALQFMVNLILSKNRRQWPRIVIDIENYRERREQALRSLADRIAYRVMRNQRPFTLEAMPAGDRRVIHLALRDRSDIETYSIGEGAARRVVIAPKRPAQSDARQD